MQTDTQRDCPGHRGCCLQGANSWHTVRYRREQRCPALVLKRTWPPSQTGAVLPHYMKARQQRHTALHATSPMQCEGQSVTSVARHAKLAVYQGQGTLSPVMVQAPERMGVQACAAHMLQGHRTTAPQQGRLTQGLCLPAGSLLHQ